jgi:hypothetical protein
VRGVVFEHVTLDGVMQAPGDPHSPTAPSPRSAGSPEPATIGVAVATYESRRSSVEMR